MARSSWLLVALAGWGCDTKEPAMPAPEVGPAAVPEVSVSPAASAPAVATAPLPAESAFGFDHVHESCNSFSAHITNASRTAWLDVHVAVKELGLKTGDHDLQVDGQDVTLEIRELANSHEGEWACTDIGGGPRQPVTHRWKAAGGTVHVRLHLPAPDNSQQPYDGPYDRVDLELKDVRFVDGSGSERRVSVRFEGLRIGWMPG